MKGRILILILIISQGIIAQINNDYPSNLNFFITGQDSILDQICNKRTVKHRVTFSEHEGKEYYCSGNLHANGEIKKHKTIGINYANRDKKETETEFVRVRKWNVYYDTIPKSLRSEGEFFNGIKNGKWSVYSKEGGLKSVIVFKNNQITSKTVIDKEGNQTVVINKTDSDISLENSKVGLILLALFPLVLIRPFWNMFTYNVINKTDYYPLFAGWQKGGYFASLYCSFIFWWRIHDDDSNEIIKFKKVGNWISILSIIVFVSTLLFLNANGV